MDNGDGLHKISASALQIHSAACLENNACLVNGLRIRRNSDPNCKLFAIKIHVCQSYERWANIGLPTRDKEYMHLMYPLCIGFDRRDPEDKKIWIVDPTNSHFYENVENPLVDGIWMDYANEVLSKIHYAFKCTCPVGKCTCSENWSICFFRCKEVQIPYEETENSYWMTVLVLARTELFYAVAIQYYEDLCAGKWPHTQTEEELNNLSFWEWKDLCAVFIAKALEKHKRLGADLFPIGMEEKPEIVNQHSMPSSEVKCEFCGKDKETMAGKLLKTCARCKKTKYCSVECQKNDWSRHRKDCTPAEIKLDHQTHPMPMMHFDIGTNKLYYALPIPTEDSTLINKIPSAGDNENNNE